MSVNGSPERRERAERLLDAVVEQHAVRKPGQRVAQGLRVRCCRACQVEDDADRGGDERAHDERGDDVVGRLAQERRREARDEHERGQAQSPHERAS